MTNNLTVKDLELIGFTKIGKWKASNLKNSKKIPCEETKPIDHEWDDENYIKSLPKKILYAFVFGEEIKYIGKTTKGAKERLKWYVKPSNTGHSTNKRVKDKIYKLVKPSGSDKNIDIWVFAPNPDTVKYKGFDLDLAAGLEEGLIAKIGTNCWNKIFKSK
jgi:hypothetical protein